MGKTFKKPEVLSDAHTHYCPGCTHGVIHRLVAEAIDDLGIRGRTVGVAPVGCAVLAYNYFDCDFQEAAHGRAPAMATGIKRVRPDLMVFTYQGDGDLVSIGDLLHGRQRDPEQDVRKGCEVALYDGFDRSGRHLREISDLAGLGDGVEDRVVLLRVPKHGMIKPRAQRIHQKRGRG